VLVSSPLRALKHLMRHCWHCTSPALPAPQLPQAEQVEGYLDALAQLAAAQQQLRAAITQPEVLLPFLQPGRLIRLLNRPPAAAGEEVQPQLPAFDTDSSNGSSSSSSSSSPVEMLTDGAWGAVVAFERVGKHKGDEEGGGSQAGQYIVDVLVACHPASVHSGASAGTKQSKPPRLVAPDTAGAVPLVVTFSTSQVGCLPGCCCLPAWLLVPGCCCCLALLMCALRGSMSMSGQC
jgi:ATP-dependent RNA helicase DOB1